MFKVKGINKGHSKEVFNYLKNHYRYDTMNSWNEEKSIAHNVKLYNLELEGDCGVAQEKLERYAYEAVNEKLDLWEDKHPGYSVGFNGRSGGYLVLYSSNAHSRIPAWLSDNEDYDHYKVWCKEYQGGVCYNDYQLKSFYNTVRSFDELCDEIRSYVNLLSLEELEEED